MSFTVLRHGDKMFESVLYNNIHKNVTGVNIDRNFNTSEIRIRFTIENVKRTRMVEVIQIIRNEDVKQYRPEHISFRANKFASLIDEVPDYIPEEQLSNYIEQKTRKETIRVY